MLGNAKNVLPIGALCLGVVCLCRAQEPGDPEVSSPSPPVQQESYASQKKEAYMFGDVELPLNNYEQGQLTRFIDAKEISLADIVSTAGIVLECSRKPAGKEDLALLKKHGLKRERTVDEASQRVLYAFTKKDMSLEDVLRFVNAQYGKDGLSFVKSAFPIFLFENGRDPHYLAGGIVIAWHARVAEKHAKVLVERMGLRVKSFDEKTRIMLADTTPRSGFNVFRIAYIFGPRNGNAFALSVEPRFVRLNIPLAVESRIMPASGLGQAGDIPGSRFQFVLTIRAQRAVTVATNELKVSAHALKQWLPKSAAGEKKEVSPQVFDVIGAERIDESPAQGDGAKTITATYQFRMAQAGEFMLSPPRVQYSVRDGQLQSVSTDIVDGEPVLLRVAGTMPSDATMVNSLFGNFFEPENPLPDGAMLNRLMRYCFAASGICLLAVAVLLVRKALAKRVKPPSHSQRVYALWEEEKRLLAEMLAQRPQGFWKTFPVRTRAILGELAYNDGHYFAAMNPKQIAKSFPGDARPELRASLENFFEEVFAIQFGSADKRSAAQGERLLAQFDAFMQLENKEASA